MKQDKITLERIKLIHPALRSEVESIYKEICEALNGRVLCRFSHTLRTFAEQDALYLKKPKVTNAKGGQSYHNYGMAVDIVMILDKDGNGTYETASWDDKLDFDGDGKSDWQEVVEIFKRYGWEWGGDWNHFPDKPHFQKKVGYSIMDLKRLYEANEFIEGTKYLNI
ncbi:MAG: M15 family metallopeptidase [Bacteroidia bacterium]|nr:M15 family metallopeptidase [Bacteroidia bacterium]